MSWPYRNCSSISVAEYPDVADAVVARSPGVDCPAGEAGEDLPTAGVPGAGVVKTIEPPTVASRTNARARFSRLISAPNPPLVCGCRLRNGNRQSVAHLDL